MHVKIGRENKSSFQKENNVEENLLNCLDLCQYFRSSSGEMTKAECDISLFFNSSD